MRRLQSTKRPNKTQMAIILCLLTALPLFGNTVYIQAKAHLAQHLINQAWVKTMQDNKRQPQLTTLHRPWAWSDSYPVTKLRVPSHRIEQTVLNGATGSALAFAPGLYAGTQHPSENNSENNVPNTVIAGHHNTHFDFLKRVKLGETVQLQTFRGQWLTYHISTIDTFDSRTQRLPALTGGDTLQLVTCLPRFIGETHPNQRLVVTAERAKMTQPLITQH